ncbi:MAG: hypothetical protein OXI77_01525 [Chloroflexota bacterium]|nr:hypothetical protein [Chloroflexota bacterium]MDE2910748.1 hypothetical protein [Chloroflexota bacterium]
MHTSEDVASVDKMELFSNLPAEWNQNLIPQIQALLRETKRKIFVLDDDPTGTQTVHDTVVLTEWTVPALVRELDSADPVCYILTNSRSVGAAEAVALNQDITRNLRSAAGQTGRRFTVISRSDSTLRGHFPAETDALAESAEAPPDAVLLIPAFMAGGRFTIQGLHYVEEGGLLVPAARTPYAEDAVFGYRHSEMRKWVEEKTSGRVQSQDVISLSIEVIRSGGPDAVEEILRGLHGGAVCVVDAVSERDLEVVALACIRAEAAGVRLIYRTAASFAGIRGGIPIQPPLDAADITPMSEHGGLVVVGSYVKKSTDQLAALLASGLVKGVELPVANLLRSEDLDAFLGSIADELAAILRDGKHAALYTSREFVSGYDDDSSLAIGRRVSKSLVDVVRRLPVSPRFIIAKGGVTSSDLATGALAIKRATVLGQILPGIPLWQPDANSRYPGGAYIVFPGNVGDDGALLRAVQILAG